MENVKEPAKHMDTSDVFESSLMLDEAQLQEGYKDGYNDGLDSGKEEGRQVGLKHGFEVGEEIGFYRGCADVWESAIRVDPKVFSERVQKGVRQMGELLQKYPLLEPENESLQEIMSAIRLKFRIITASLGVKIEYDGYPKEDKVSLDVHIVLPMFLDKKVSMNHFSSDKGCETPAKAMGGRIISPETSKNRNMLLDEKIAAIHSEMDRLSKLPAISNYVRCRTLLLGKVLRLLSTQRTASQDEELEQLFAGLSL